MREDYLKKVEELVGRIGECDLKVVFRRLDGRSVGVVGEMLCCVKFNEFELVG